MLLAMSREHQLFLVAQLVPSLMEVSCMILGLQHTVLFPLTTELVASWCHGVFFKHRSEDAGFCISAYIFIVPLKVRPFFCHTCYLLSAFADR